MKRTNKDISGFAIGNVELGPGRPFFLIAGPCVIESRSLCLQIGRFLSQVCKALGVGVIFKASFDKANRTSLTGFRGPGLERGLRILDAVKEQTGLPVLTDIHLPEQAPIAAKVVDCLQIPAFLCRQTDLLIACARTGRPINVKKGQFLSPGQMANVVEKIKACGNHKIILTERGTFFGYNRLVNDMTAIPEMRQLGCLVVFDATHSTQEPGGLGHASGGRPEMAPVLARAAIAAGADGLFVEVHPHPKTAKSDAACMMDLEKVPELVQTCKRIWAAVRSEG